MATTATEIQALYVAYFNRPADPTGLAFWLDRANTKGGADFVANEFSNSKEYTDLYAGKSYVAIVDSIYMNLFGRHAEAKGLTEWALKLQKGELNIGNVARTIALNAQNEDKIAVDSKVAAAIAFTDSLTTGEEIAGYDGDAANLVAKNWLATVKTDADLKAATTAAALDAVAAAAADARYGQTATNNTLTDKTDTLNGTASNDIFNATGATFNPLDSIDGGAGVNTFNLVDANATQGNGLPALSKLTNIQKFNVTTTGSVGSVAAAAVPAAQEVKTYTIGAAPGATDKLTVTIKGVTVTTAALTDTATGQAELIKAINAAFGATIAVKHPTDAGVVVVTAPVAGTALPTITISANAGAAVDSIPVVATTQANATGSEAVADAVYDVSGVTGLTNFNAAANGSVNAKVSDTTNVLINTTKGGVTVAGGLTVKSAGATGAVSIKGAALTSVSSSGGTTVDISNDTAGTTLKSVTVSGNTGKATLTGDALTSVSLASTNQAAEIKNTTDKHTLDLALNAVTGGATITDAKAATVNLTVTGAKATTATNVNLDLDIATKLAINNAAALTLTTTALAADSKLTTVTIAGAGSVTADLKGVTSLTSVDASTSTGANTLTVKADVAGLVVKGGAGADTVNTVGVLDAKAVITLGAGNDVYSFDKAAAAGATVNGGDGTDTLKVVDGDLLDAPAAKVYSGFETLDISGGKNAYDMSVLGLTAVTLDSDLVANATIKNAAANTTVSISSAKETATTISKDLVFGLKDDTGAADVVTLNLTAVDGKSDGVAKGSVTVSSFTAANIETVKISSNVKAVDVNDPATPADESTVAGKYINTVTKLVADKATSLVLSGASKLVITGVQSDALNKIDATAATGDVEFGGVVKAADGVAAAKGSISYLGGSGVDTYFGTAKGDLIAGNGGADIINLAAAGGKDTLSYAKASDSVLTFKDTDADGKVDAASGFDVVKNFTSTEDKIDISAFNLATGAGRGALTLKTLAGGTDADLIKLVGDGAKFFNDNVANRAVAFATNGTDGFVFVDVNGDGNFNAANDMAIKLVGVTTLVVSDISFG